MSKGTEAKANIVKVLELTRDMLILADQGENYCAESACGVLYGALRDTAFRIRKLAEAALEKHRVAGTWDTNLDGNQIEKPSAGDS